MGAWHNDDDAWHLRHGLSQGSVRDMLRADPGGYRHIGNNLEQSYDLHYQVATPERVSLASGEKTEHSSWSWCPRWKMAAFAPQAWNEAIR